MTTSLKLFLQYIAAISIVILLSAYIFLYLEKNNVESGPRNTHVEAQALSPELEQIIKEVSGKPIEPDMQAFEDIIQELLLISFDNKRGGFAGRKEIDMQSRKRYFTNNSFSAYSAYVEQQKKDIIQLGTDSGAPYTCKGIFDYGSQKYTKDVDGNTIFSAAGRFSCGAWDSYDSYGRFKIEIVTNTDVTKPNNLIINKWNIKILEAVDERSNGSTH